ncbi:TPA: hypothetical protein OGU99_000600 [Escherichia coli]|nr:hypothetical protein [Escherichia coli]
MQIIRGGRTFNYMLAENINVIYNTHNIKTPKFYTNEISNKHTSIKILGYAIKKSSEYIGNKTPILYEYNGVLLTRSANYLMKANNISRIRYTDKDIVYVANCILEFQGNDIRCNGYIPSGKSNRHGVYGNYTCNLECKCGCIFERKMCHIVENGNITNCPDCYKRKTFNGSHEAYFYVNKFIHNSEVVYKYGVTHNLTNRRELFKYNNRFDSEEIIAVLFENSVEAADLEDMLKYTNLINHMQHVKIKDGCTELTDEAGLKFIMEELTYMGKL